jgi:hypothetical protein
MKSKEKKLVRKRTWSITIEQFNDGSTTMKRTSDGFLGFELLGLIEQMKQDILKQLSGDIKPDIIERKYIKGEK